MSKERRTVTLEPKVDDYLAREGVNASELVNKLVRHHMNGGGDNELLEFRKQQVKSEYQQLATQTRQKLNEFNRLEEQQQRREEDAQSTWDDAVADLENTPRKPDSPPIKYWAEELDITPEKLCAELPNREGSDDGLASLGGDS